MDPSQTRILFSSLAAELAGMMETVDGLSSLVAEHARQAPAGQRSAVLVKAQAIDELHQTLDSLRGLAGALSSGVPVEDALAGISLSALADRLRGESGCSAPAAPARSGDLILFE